MQKKEVRGGEEFVDLLKYFIHLMTTIMTVIRDLCGLGYYVNPSELGLTCTCKSISRALLDQARAPVFSLVARIFFPPPDLATMIPFVHTGPRTRRRVTATGVSFSPGGHLTHSAPAVNAANPLPGKISFPGHC
jgi:hypothetical protein